MINLEEVIMVLVEAITTVVEVIFHRRRIYTEAKAKVVPSVWGAEFIPCRASCFGLGRIKE